MSRATIAAAAEYWDLAIEEIVGPSRADVLAMARSAAAYVMRHRDGMSYPWIGKRLGGRDHSTILHSVKIIAERWIERDEVFAEFIEAQMALPKFSRKAIVPARPEEPEAVVEEAPRTPLPVVPPPKPELQWEKIGCGVHALAIREDGLTRGDLHELERLKRGTQAYLAALHEQYPDRFPRTGDKNECSAGLGDDSNAVNGSPLFSEGPHA